MPAPHFDARSKLIAAYYKNRDELAQHGIVNELGVREAFRELLQEAAKGFDLKLLMEQKLPGLRRRPDATLRSQNMPNVTTLDFGHWEAKDGKDDLMAEIARKIAAGYPTKNIIFEDTRQAVLYQDKQPVGTYDLKDPADVATLLNRFFSYTQSTIEDFKLAMQHFTEETPELAKGLRDEISRAHTNNTAFQTAFEGFMEQCRRDLNPRITREQVDDMLIQHMLTERLIRILFQDDFVDRNIIAIEVQKVIRALASKSFSLKAFLGKLDYFYKAIEAAAPAQSNDFAEKQTFLNDVYERFFQKYSFKVADTHGIVYTPQPIVEFMVALVEDALHREFGYGLDHNHVCVIDPCTGTGNFIVQLLRRMAMRSHDPNDLKNLYRDRLFANEVMLLPYYIASLNIERTFYELTGSVETFEGLCFVDTLDLAEKRQKELTGFITEKNADRVERQQRAPITVIIGNPPYNAGQKSENDNNKNRTYSAVEQRVRETYVKDSKATSKSKVDDVYVKFFRWASDRLQGRDGIVCYVTNNSFVDGLALDGMRKHLLEDFTHVYHLDLHGNVRQNPKLSGTTHNVFGIQVGVGITLAIKSQRTEGRGLHYHRVPETDRREEKLDLLTRVTSTDIGQTLKNTPQTYIVPDVRHTWRIADNADEFLSFMPIGGKETKRQKSGTVEAIFKTYSYALNSARDQVVYDVDRNRLIERVQSFVEDYNAEVDRYRRAGKPKDIDSFVKLNQVKWSEGLKGNLVRGRYAEFQEVNVRQSLYRPFSKRYLYFDAVLNERRYQQHKFYPIADCERENRMIAVTHIASEKPFMVLMSSHITDLHVVGAGANAQCYPFYTYNEDGSNRRENITDWALKEFQDHYSDPSITKWDIFYYVYGALHSPAYRAKFAANLKRDLPRLPFAPLTLNPSPTGGEGLDGFWHYAKAGRALADLHVGYESVTPYDLNKVWGKADTQSARSMKFTPDKTGIKVSDAVTVTGIPPEAQAYVLGSRSALAWLVDQYPAPTSDEAAAAMADLIARVTTVSVQTMAIVGGL